MIIDCHGHYTTEPAQLTRFRQAQLAALDGGTGAGPPPDSAASWAPRKRCSWAGAVV